MINWAIRSPSLTGQKKDEQLESWIKIAKQTLKVLLSQIEQQYVQDTTVICIDYASPGIDTEFGG